MFFSPEAVAVRSDPVLGGMSELALLDHLFSGWKNLEPRYGARGELPGFALGVDDPIPMSRHEKLIAESNEVRNALGMDEDSEQFFSSLNPDERQYVRDLITKHISGGAIDKIGALGTGGRVYPKGHELEGEKIPVNWQPGQQRERGIKLLMDKAAMVDPDTGIALHGVDIDAMHRKPAAQYPELINDVDNIKFGPRSMNQGDGDAEGEELRARRQGRGMNLYDKLFVEENGVPNKWRGNLDETTRRENLAQTKFENKVEELLAAIRGDVNQSNTSGDNESRPMVIDSHGGDIYIGDKAAKEIRRSRVGKD
jgi:hypothetical protein